MKNKIQLHEVGQLLDLSITQLDAHTVDQLQSARLKALQHQRISQNSPVWAWLDQHGLISHTTHSHKHLNWGMAALLALILFSGVLYWQQYEHDHSEVDIAILTDDLPVDMYVD